MKSGFKIKGCYRVHLKKDGKIVGDSGWLDNTLTNVGIEKFVAHNLVAGGSSLRLGWAALGTGGAPGTATTQLPGEIMSSTQRLALASTVYSARSTSDGSGTLWLYGTYSSTDNFMTASANISNIGLYNASAAGTLFAGNTYASSQLSSNQDVNYTYQLQLG